MKKRSNKRINVLALFCGLIGLIMLPVATSYTNALVPSSASLSVTNTSNALVALHLPDSGVYFLGDTISGSITNNMATTITLTDANGGTFNQPSLASGATTSFSFPTPPNSGTYNSTITAIWPNGSAKIGFSLPVTVVDPSDLSATWDGNQITVANNSGHSITVQVEGGSGTLLIRNSSATFAPAGDYTTITYSLGARQITVSLATPPPPPASPSLETSEKLPVGVPEATDLQQLDFDDEQEELLLEEEEIIDG